MAKKFKDYYGQEVAQVLADKILSVRPDFEASAFVSYIVQNTADKEMLQRQDVVVDAFEMFLGKDYVSNIELFTQILGPKLEKETGMFTEGWWLWPIGRYVERYGLANKEIGYAFIFELTQRFTGEFAIRPLLREYPQETLTQMHNWSQDPSVHVRRLASEGIRIRLPWAPKVDVYHQYPEQRESIWYTLKTDPSKFVQKSVANGINDLIKEDREAGLTLLKGWIAEDPSPETKWIINHALRWLVKKGDEEGMELLEKLMK